MSTDTSGTAPRPTAVGASPSADTDPPGTSAASTGTPPSVEPFDRLPALDAPPRRPVGTGPPAGLDIDPEERIPRSFHLSRQILERARAAAYWLSQVPAGAGPTTISELVEQALLREVERLEREHNDGEAFPAVLGRMRTGPGAAGAERIRRAQRARHRAGGTGR